MRLPALLPGCLALAALALSHAALAQEPPPPGSAPAAHDTPSVDELIRDLGDKSFAVRRRAERALSQVGLPAKAPLIEALRHPDAEVRYRARRVLAAVLELDFEARLSAFITDLETDNGHELALWDRYRELVGSDPQARRLFVEMQRDERALLEAAQASPARTGELIEARCQQIQHALQLPNAGINQQVSLGTVAAFLFVCADSEVPVSTQAGSSLNSFSYQEAFQQAMTGGEQVDALKKLLGAWIRRDFTNDAVTSYQNLMLALRYELKDGIEPALAVLRAPGTPAHMRQYAILALGKLGSKEHLGVLEPLLADESVCAAQEVGEDEKQVETQIRDVALAVLVHLTGQNLAEYGFDRIQPNALLLFNTPSLGFVDSARREAALAKWRSWAAAKNGPSRHSS